MGAALLSKPDLACSIISTLSSNLSIPVTCKIRLLSFVEDTVGLCKRVVPLKSPSTDGPKTSDPSIRTETERLPLLPSLCPCRHCQVTGKPFGSWLAIDGGSKEIQCHGDIEQFRLACGTSGVMLAWAAQRDCTIFRPRLQNSVLLPDVLCSDGVGAEASMDPDVDISLEPLIKDYLHYAVRYASPALNVKYCIQAMLKDLQDTPLGKKFLETQTLLQIWTCLFLFPVKYGEWESSAERQRSSRSCRGISSSPTQHTSLG